MDENIQSSSNIELNQDSQTSVAASPNTPAKPNLMKSKKRKVEEMSPYQSKLIGCLEALQNNSSEEPMRQHNNDEYDYFGKSVAEQIRKLPTAFARARAKKEIQDILFHIEFDDTA